MGSALVAWPGSHRERNSNRKMSSAERKWAERRTEHALANNATSVFSGVEMAPLTSGSVVAYHSDLWHYGGANSRDLPRVVLYASFLVGSEEAMQEAADGAATKHSLALDQEYKRQRLTL